MGQNGERLALVRLCGGIAGAAGLTLAIAVCHVVRGAVPDVLQNCLLLVVGWLTRDLATLPTTLRHNNGAGGAPPAPPRG